MVADDPQSASVNGAPRVHSPGSSVAHSISMPSPATRASSSAESVAFVQGVMEDDEVGNVDAIPVAALYIESAFEYTFFMHPREGEWARKLHLMHVKLQPYRKWANLMLVMLCFFELPTWCAKDIKCRASLDNGQLTGLYESGRPLFGSEDLVEAAGVIYPLSGIYIFPSWLCSTLEFLLLPFLTTELAFKVGAQGLRRFVRKGPKLQPLYLTLFVVTVIDALLRLAIPWPAGYVAPYLRILLLVLSSATIRQEFRLIGHTLKPLMGIAIVFVSFMVFTSWTGILLFASNVPGSQGAVYFTSIGETAWQLFILFTTANYPDVMMPAYNEARAWFFFFFVFVTLGTFFLCNIIIAVVSNAYNSEVERVDDHREAFRKEQLAKAFKILDGPNGTGALPRSRIEEVFVELNHYKQVLRAISPDRAKLIFHALDLSGDGVLDVDEFGDVCSLLAVRFKRIADSAGPCQRAFPSFFASEPYGAMSAVVRHRYFEWGIDGLLVINMIILIIEQRPILAGDAESFTSQPWSRPVEIVFTTLFVVEVLIKLLVYGWRDYVARPANVFDLAVTTTMLITMLATIGVTDSSGALKFVLAIRLGRLLRLIAIFPQVGLVTATFFRMVPTAAKLLKVLLVTMFCFSTFGVQLFGGEINMGPNKAKLEHNSFGKSGYWANNFNDVASGMVVCFELLVVNNWFVLSGGFEQVAPVPLVRLFFIVVYVFGVLVCLNIVIAFAIDSYDKALQHEHDLKGQSSAEGGGAGAAGDGHGEDGDGADLREVRARRPMTASVSEARDRYKSSVPIFLRDADRVKDRLGRVFRNPGPAGDEPLQQRSPTEQSARL